MGIMVRIFGDIVSAFAATRYLITAIVVLISLGYGLLTLLELVPSFRDLAFEIGISTRLLYIAFYFFTSIVICLLWLITVVIPQQTNIQYLLAWRRIYRLTDQTGLEILAILSILIIASSTFLVARQIPNEYDRDGLVFIAIVLLVPIILDILNWIGIGRRRRATIPQTGKTLNQISQALAGNSREQGIVDRIANDLMSYNSFVLQQVMATNSLQDKTAQQESPAQTSVEQETLGDAVGSNTGEPENIGLDQELPEGLILEVPPLY